MAKRGQKKETRVVDEGTPRALTATEATFDTSVSKPTDTGGLTGVASREQAEIQAALVVALRRPRDELKCYEKIMRSCERSTFAEKARYVFPRGGTKVEGPSVQLAREMARIWGNLRYGYRTVDESHESTTMEGWCWDLETNSKNMATVTFRNKIWRKGKGWIVPDERDYIEMCNRNGAKAIRNAILQIMPPDIVEEAMVAVKKTLVKSARGEIEEGLESAVRRMVKAFREHNVSPAMLEAKLGHPLPEITAKELADLRGIWVSIADGNSKAAEEFPPAKAAPDPEEKPKTLDDVEPNVTEDGEVIE